MTCELLLLRHAKSSWNDTGVTDFERPLSKRGRHDAARIGGWLRHQRLTPDHVISSPALRARQTALRVLPELSLEPGAISWDDAIYDASIKALLKVLANGPAAASRILLIGHNPGLEQLLLWLAPQIAIPADGKLLPTAAVAWLELSADWAALNPGCGRLRALQRPPDLHD